MKEVSTIGNVTTVVTEGCTYTIDPTRSLYTFHRNQNLPRGQEPSNKTDHDKSAEASTSRPPSP
ncbi:MAG: hypothetical protein SFW07_06455 [Gammaproteobacteria bacterium]|nr:hypothetical protein [Gammaproteobacteria bacterium]